MKYKNYTMISFKNEYLGFIKNTFTDWNRLQGVHILNSDNKKIHVRDIAEQHILEDFRGKFIPTMNDYSNNMNLKGWMNNALGDINKTNDSNEQKELKAVINFD